MKRRNTILITAAIVLALGICAFLSIWNGWILLNNPSKEDYPVRGVDVSSYQGEIDWQVLAKQDIAFAFIKATEGSAHTDPRFAYNLEQAAKTQLRIGAYHFFSYDSSGKTQAEHFIATVPQMDGMLPPVVDLEFYGDYARNPPDAQAVCAQLDVMLSMLQEHYGMKPVIYATEKSYELYLAGRYDDCDIWIRNVISEPSLSDGRSWTFWQYTNRETLDGYTGEERFIDVNVFNGSAEEFEKYGK